MESNKDTSSLSSKPCCSLCHSDRLIKVEEIETKVLKKFYSTLYNLDVSQYFPQDKCNVYLCAECGLRTQHPAIPGDGAFYDHMQKFKFYYEEDKPEFKYAIDTLIKLKPTTVLEVGCGEGNFLDKIRHAFPVKAAELSESSIQKLKNKGIELDNDGDMYDYCASFQVLEHVPDAHEFLSGIIAKLNKQGHMLISVPNKDSKYFNERFGVLDYPPHHMTQWSKSSLESIARIFSLEIVDYYEEPHRIEHYSSLIKARREKILGKKGVRSKIVKAISMVMDPFLAPYYLDRIDYSGMTHAMLYRKKD